MLHTSSEVLVLEYDLDSCLQQFDCNNLEVPRICLLPLSRKRRIHSFCSLGISSFVWKVEPRQTYLAVNALPCHLTTVWNSFVLLVLSLNLLAKKMLCFIRICCAEKGVLITRLFDADVVPFVAVERIWHRWCSKVSSF